MLGTSLLSLREARCYTEPVKPKDLRPPARRDRDRILYSSAFKRLADVTQVVAANNAHVFHNRLTHSLQVAQVGQSIAEQILAVQQPLAEQLGGIDPDVVQAACLAHDLGHPPFGHTAENELKELATANGLSDSFEGNAQSFRVVTRLAFRSIEPEGLNLTRATLAAILKYPRLRQSTGEGARKWGAYESEKKDFDCACKLLPGPERRTVEAELMDWADDVTYAVHDVEDFYRAGLIPMHVFADEERKKERKEFCEEAFKRELGQGGIGDTYTLAELETSFDSIVALFGLDEPFEGTQLHRSLLRKFTAECIHRFVGEIRLREHRAPAGKWQCLDINPATERQVAMLKELTWRYVINDPAMAAQQYGQRRVIHTLFDCFYQAASKDNLKIFPRYYQDKMRNVTLKDKTRFVVDLIAGMTERQCSAMYERMTGTTLAHSFDRILT